MNNFANIDFPEHIYKVLNSKQNNLLDKLYRNKYIDFALLKQRADVWNNYAICYDFCQIGSVYANDKDDPEEVYIIVDIIPKGYVFDSGEKAEENYYVTFYLGNDVINIPEKLDVMNFLKTGYIGCRTTDLDTEYRINQYRQLVSNNFWLYFLDLTAKAAEFTELLKGEIVVCETHDFGFRNYYITKVDKILPDYNTPGKFIVYHKSGRYRLSKNDYSGCPDVTWKFSVEDDPCYIHINKYGNIAVRSVKRKYGFYDGLIIDMDKVKNNLTWRKLLFKFKKCDNLWSNEFYEIYKELPRKIIKVDE